MGVKQPGLNRVALRRAGEVDASTSSGGGAGFSRSVQAPYAAPFTFTLTDASGPAQILNQWWINEARITDANLSIFLGVECRMSVAGNIAPVFGLFLLADGDVLASTLWVGLVQPSVQVPIPMPTAAFHGYDGTATVVNPGLKRQLLLAVKPISTGCAIQVPSTFEWRSAGLDFLGSA